MACLRLAFHVVLELIPFLALTFSKRVSFALHLVAETPGRQEATPTPLLGTGFSTVRAHAL